MLARREKLSARIAALEPKIGNNPAAQALLAEAHRLVDDDLRFAADIDFAVREIEQAEALVSKETTQSVIAPPAQEAANWFVYLALVIVGMGIGSSIYIVRRRPRPRYPEADARYRAVIADLGQRFGRKF